MKAFLSETFTLFKYL